MLPSPRRASMRTAVQESLCREIMLSMIDSTRTKSLTTLLRRS